MKLDLGCGKHPKEGFEGVDISPDVEAKHVLDLLAFPWPFEGESVEEVHCSHFFEHVPAKLRPKLMDELYRILKPGAQASFITPYWASSRAYQDFTHEWPPIAESSYLYFNKGWRVQNGLDHYPVSCDFDFTYSRSINPTYQGRSNEFLGQAADTMLGVVLDLHVTLVKRPPQEASNAPSP